MNDYADILSRSVGEIPVVKPLPVGSWLLRARSASYQPPRKQDGNASVLVVYTPKEPMEDVDDSALSELGDDYDYASNRVFYRAWIETDADWDKVRNLARKHGFEPKGTIKDMLEGFKGQEVIAHLNQNAFTDAAGEAKIENVPTSFHAVEG